MSLELSSTDSEFVRIRIIGQNANQLVIKVKKNIQFIKIFEMYCNRYNFDLNELRFHFDERRIGKFETPLMLEMQNDDIINADKEQDGGQ
jgi:small ubiquitin-related modifier